MAHPCYNPDLRAGAERAALIDALEESPDHELTIGEWMALVLRFAPREYAEPKPPPEPGRQGLSREERLVLMTARVKAGRLPVRPDDPWAFDADADFPGGFVLRNGRNGSTYEGEGVTHG